MQASCAVSLREKRQTSERGGMARKLASVQYVHDVWPIEGADRVEAIGVLGWKCVAKKGEFKVGDWCVYFEIDSFLPVDERFEFLRATSYKNSDLLGEGFRLKTQRFRGQISQGLALPTSIAWRRGCALPARATSSYRASSAEAAFRGIR